MVGSLDHIGLIPRRSPMLFELLDVWRCGGETGSMSAPLPSTDFAELYARHAGEVLAFLIPRLNGNRDDAADVAHDVWLRDDPLGDV